MLGPKASFTGAWRYEQIKWVAEKEKQSRIGNDREPIERNALSNVQSDAILPELELPDDQRTVHMIWFNSCNALVCMPAEPQRWINACQKMDFNVVQDLFMRRRRWPCAICSFPFPRSSSMTASSRFTTAATPLTSRRGEGYRLRRDQVRPGSHL